METCYLRTLDIPGVERLYAAHIRADFPADERPPAKIMARQVQSGFLSVLVMTDGKEDYAYAIAATQDDYVLYTHLAVYPEHRGGGYGSRLMELLHQAYTASRVHLVEVENPEAADDEQTRMLRQRRIVFYERAGYVLVPRIHYILYGVDMLLMTHTGDGAEVPPQEVADTLRRLYHSQIPEKDRHHLDLAVTD